MRNVFRESLVQQFLPAPETAFTASRDHFTRQAVDSSETLFFTTHTQFLVGGRKFAVKRKSRKNSSHKNSRAQSGQFSVVRPHIRGEHGILMIAFWVNFRYELYRCRLLFSIFHVHEGAFSFSNFHVCRRCHEGVNEKAAKNARERKSFLIHVPHYVLVSF